MRCCKLGDVSPIRERESVKAHDESSGTLPDCGVEGRSKILRLSHVEKLGLHPEGSRGRLDRFPLRRDSWITHVEEGRDSHGAWNQRSEELNAFRI
jgi:hypothetical protein